MKDLMHKRFNSPQKRFTDREASQIMKSILEAVAYIHNQNITHRDLKPLNILMKDQNDMSSVKLIDFGLGDKHQVSSETCGTYIYMAPEIVNKNQKYTKSVDIWAIGIIMHQILTGNKHPYYDPKMGDDREALKEKLKKLRHVEPDKSLSKLAKNLFERLMAVPIPRRYTAKDALHHPWITRQLESEVPLAHFQREGREG